MSDKGNSKLEGEALGLFLLNVFLIVFMFIGVAGFVDGGDRAIPGAIVFGSALISFTLIFIKSKK